MVEKLTLSVREASETLGISENLAYQLIREGKLPAIRVSERRLIVPRASLLKMLGQTDQGAGKDER